MKKSWHRAKRGSSRQPYQWLKSLFRTISPHKIITVCGCPEHSPLLVSNAILNKCFISTVLILKRLKKRDIRKLNPALTDFLWIPDRNVQIKLVLTFLFLQLYVKKEKGRGKLSENFFWGVWRFDLISRDGNRKIFNKYGFDSDPIWLF